jgi:hypothetical protein
MSTGLASVSISWAGVSTSLFSTMTIDLAGGVCEEAWI